MEFVAVFAEGVSAAVFAGEVCAHWDRFCSRFPAGVFACCSVWCPVLSAEDGWQYIHTYTQSELALFRQSNGMAVRVNTAHGDGRVRPAPVPENRK